MRCGWPDESKAPVGLLSSCGSRSSGGRKEHGISGFKSYWSCSHSLASGCTVSPPPLHPLPLNSLDRPFTFSQTPNPALQHPHSEESPPLWVPESPYQTSRSLALTTLFCPSSPWPPGPGTPFIHAPVFLLCSSTDLPVPQPDPLA